MTQGFESRTTGSPDDLYEDTIELEMTGEQVLGLSQAAKGAQTTARPAEFAPDLSSPAAPSSKPRLDADSAKRFPLWRLTLAVAVVGITATLAWWAAAQRAADKNAPAPAVSRPAPPVIAPPAARAEPQGPPVQVRNPFDATEVFEFPAETTKTEARKAMAELLQQRARDRRSKGVGIKHTAGRHTAPGAADENPAASIAR